MWDQLNLKFNFQNLRPIKVTKVFWCFLQKILPKLRISSYAKYAFIVSAPIEHHSWLECHIEQNAIFLPKNTLFSMKMSFLQQKLVKFENNTTLKAPKFIKTRYSIGAAKYGISMWKILKKQSILIIQVLFAICLLF